MWGILLVVLIIVIFVVSLALLIGISLGLGWVLTLFLPFSLFEATLLGLLATTITGLFWRHILTSVAPPFPSEERDVYEDEDEEEEPDEIPHSRFWRTEADRTWEKWYQYLLANAIYEDLFDSPRGLVLMPEDQLQEMSVHLAQGVVEILKEKSARTKRININRGLLKQAMVKIGHPVTDDSLLNTAVAAANMEFLYLDEELREVMRERTWAEPAEVY